MKKGKAVKPTAQVAHLLRSICSQPRLEILLTIGRGEACVCHLEAALGWRQAYISQHLMALRQAGILDTRRDGKYIFYRLQDPALLNWLHDAASLVGVVLHQRAPTGPENQCSCPKCSPETIPVLEAAEGTDV